MYYTADETEMLVTWTTYNAVDDSPKVEFGHSESDLHNHAKAEVTHFVEDKTGFYTYRAMMTGLKPEFNYCKCFIQKYNLTYSID